MWEWLSSTHRDSADFQAGSWAIFRGGGGRKEKFILDELRLLSVTALLVLLSMRLKKKLENAKIFLFCFGFFCKVLNFGTVSLLCWLPVTLFLLYYSIFTLCLICACFLPTEQYMQSPWGGSVAKSWSRTQSQDKSKKLCALSGVTSPSNLYREMFPLFFLFSCINDDSEQSPLVDVPCQHRWCQEVSRQQKLNRLKWKGLFL